MLICCCLVFYLKLLTHYYNTCYSNYSLNEENEDESRTQLNFESDKNNL